MTENPIRDSENDDTNLNDEDQERKNSMWKEINYLFCKH